MKEKVIYLEKAYGKEEKLKHSKDRDEANQDNTNDRS